MKKLNPIRMTVAVVALALAAGVLPAAAAPVCSTVPEAACGLRIFAEPTNSATFVQHENGECEAGIKALATRFPRFVRVRSLDEILGDPAAVSQGGRKIWVIEVPTSRRRRRTSSTSLSPSRFTATSEPVSRAAFATRRISHAGPRRSPRIS